MPDHAGLRWSVLGRTGRLLATMVVVVVAVGVCALAALARSGSTRSYGVGDAPFNLASGDFNRDGNRDLVVAEQGQFMAPGNDSVSVLLGMHGGRFRKAVHYSVGNGPTAVAVGDFNRDHRKDLAVTNGFSDDVSILLGRAQGRFRRAVNYSVGSGVAPYSVAVGDFNEDGRADLAVGEFFAPRVAILFGRRNGTFGPAQNRAAGSGEGTASVVIRDFNRDGHRDFATTGADGVAIRLGAGNGKFRAPRRYPTGQDPTSIAAGRFNKDKKLDLAVANQHDPVASRRHHTVTVLLGRRHGRFGRARSYLVGRGPETVAVGDLTGDGIQDI